LFPSKNQKVPATRPRGKPKCSLSGVRAYEIMLTDTKADLMKDDRGAVDIYV
jgi:hypothetical protein